MSAHVTKRTLIIDADVLCAASDDASSPGTTMAQVLKAVLDICHRGGVTRQLADEWREHSSRYARSWQIAMAGARKRVPLRPRSTRLRKRVLDAEPSDDVRRIMEKDWHLVEAALAADHVILSRERHARVHYVRAAEREAELRSLIWINVRNCDQDALLAWLEGRAEPLPEWRLAPE